MKGWVYVISNKAMPGLIKVGYSMKDPELRADELNHTGSPHPYLVDYDVLIEEPRNVEQTVHGLLRNKREGKEWFRCSAEEAISVIKSVAGSKAQIENFKRTDRAKAEAMRAAEEESQKIEATLNTKRQEIIYRYESLLNSTLPKTSFWSYFAGVTTVLIVVISIILPKINDTAIVMLSTFGAFTISPFLKEHFEKKAKKSAKYKSIIEMREAELSTIENSKINNTSFKQVNTSIYECNSCGQKNRINKNLGHGSYKCGKCGASINNPFK